MQGKSSMTAKTIWGILIGVFYALFPTSVFALSPAPPSGCISWWPGDGDANDVIGPNNGTLQNGAGFTTGRFGLAFQFDGNDDLVSAGTKDLSTGNSDRTLELWVKIDTRVAHEAFFAGYGNFGTDTQSYALGAAVTSTQPFFSQWGTGCIGGEVLKNGEWYHIAATNLRDLATLYVNGVESCSATVPINTAANTRFYIGRIPGALGDIRRLNGAVDEVRIYDRALSVSEIQEIYAGGGGQSLSFSDVSDVSGITNQNVGTTGVQWIDYNGDGRLDLFLAGLNGCALFKNSKSGKFTEVTTQLGIGNQGRSARGASWADVDNDGRPDVFIANATGAATLLLNKKTGFDDISSSLQSIAASGATTRAGVWVDINNDQLIDLFVINEGASNQLFKQTGNTHFSDMAGKAGVDFKGAGRSAVSADFDGDGFLDIYLTNDKQPNQLYINNGDETFKEVGKQAGVALDAESIQAAVADFNGDQKIDLFVVNHKGVSVLYQNLGDSKFKKKRDAALKKAKNGIATASGDFDLDGDEDLLLQSAAGNFLFTNDGNGKFQQEKGVSLNHSNNTFGLAVGDFNQDGAPDIAIGDGLFKNDSGSGNQFLTLILKGTKSNRSGIGATVLVQTGSTFQIKVVSAGNGNSQGGFPLHFGVGNVNEVDSLRVIWPSGADQVFQHVKANRILKITEK